MHSALIHGSGYLMILQDRIPRIEDEQMFRITKAQERPLSVLIGAHMFLVLAGMSDIAFAQDATSIPERVSVTRQGTLAEREKGLISDNVQNEHAGLELTGKRAGNTQSSAQSKITASGSASPNVDYWFYSADVELFYDHDGDGYYYGIDLWFDADTYHDSADVYAVMYLSYEGGPWNEYAATDDFTIFGTSSDDDYVVETELISGYPRGSYDILIELFDSYDNEFLASIGPADTSELAFLPLEDANRDAPAIVVHTVTGHHGGGGSMGLATLLVLVAGSAGVSRISRRRRPDRRACGPR